MALILSFPGLEPSESMINFLDTVSSLSMQDTPQDYSVNILPPEVLVFLMKRIGHFSSALKQGCIFKVVYL